MFLYVCIYTQYEQQGDVFSIELCLYDWYRNRFFVCRKYNVKKKWLRFEIASVYSDSISTNPLLLLLLLLLLENDVINL